MLKFVFLDLDDTILDFQMAEAEALKKTLRAVHIEPTEQIVKRYSQINRSQWELLEKGELTREQVKLRRFVLLFEELGVVTDAEAARKYYEQQLGVGHYFLPGAEELLNALYKAYDLYIMSNGTTAVQVGRIESANIKRFFQEIFLSEAVGFVKPQKEFFDACFAKIQAFDPTQAIIIGDSLTSDIQGGIHAGIKTCWFNPNCKVNTTSILPDFEVHDLSEIPALLSRL